MFRGILRAGLTPIQPFYFRVEPSVAGWLPHSPVRAQLRHTVLQARISLRRQSGPPFRKQPDVRRRRAVENLAHILFDRLDRRRVPPLTVEDEN